MKRARVTVFAIALVAAFGAVLLAKSFLGKPKTRVEVRTDFDTVKVLVAAADIPLGDILKSGSDLKWQEWPRDAASKSYITKSKQPEAIKELADAIARAPFLKGEPITEQKLIKKSEGGVMAAILPAGRRAVSTSISEESAAGLFILPNDRVDVVLTRRMRSRRGGGDEHVSDTLFHNVRVLAIGQAIETKDDKKTAQGNTATLELSAVQAEALALARSMGEISLVLRSLADSRPSETDGENNGKDFLRKERGNSVRLLRYGHPSRAYGVN